MKWVGLFLFGGLGLAALIGGAVWGIKRYSLIQDGLQALGKVVSQEEVEGTEQVENYPHRTNKYIAYYPVVEFQTDKGEKIRFRGNTGGMGKPEIETGTAVNVVYNPDDPSKAQIGEFTQFWLGPAVVTGAGLLFFLMGVGVFFLIGGQDRKFASQFEMMRRQSLMMRGNSIVVKGIVSGIKETDGKYIFLCKATRPGSMLID